MCTSPVIYYVLQISFIFSGLNFFSFLSFLLFFWYFANSCITIICDISKYQIGGQTLEFFVSFCEVSGLGLLYFVDSCIMIISDISEYQSGGKLWNFFFQLLGGLGTFQVRCT